MLEDRYRKYLIDGHKRFEASKDRSHIDDAVNLVKTLSPQSFFKGDKDKALEKRIFYHAPFSVYWSGNAVNHNNAYAITMKEKA